MENPWQNDLSARVAREHDALRISGQILGGHRGQCRSRQLARTGRLPARLGDNCGCTASAHAIHRGSDAANAASQPEALCRGVGACYLRLSFFQDPGDAIAVKQFRLSLVRRLYLAQYGHRHSGFFHGRGDHELLYDVQVQHPGVPALRVGHHFRSLLIGCCISASIHGASRSTLIGYGSITKLLDTIYYLWFFAVYISVTVCIGTPANPEFRHRFLLSFVLIWSMLGIACATALSSAGPIYFDRIYGVRRRSAH